MPGLGSCFRPPDLVVSRFFRWILSNSEDLFALKMHLICPEIQFFQTPGRGGATALPDPSMRYAFETVDHNGQQV